MFGYLIFCLDFPDFWKNLAEPNSIVYPILLWLLRLGEFLVNQIKLKIKKPKNFG
jgi:hypothetical protein